MDWPRVPLKVALPDDFVARLLAGEVRAVQAMARSARLRSAARAVLGNALYDRLRGWLVGRG